jgi:LCP family protein required for cell wall assembly
MKPSRSKKYLPRGLIVIGSLVVILVVVGLFSLPALQKRWKAPLGPALDLPTHTPTLPGITSTQSGNTNQKILTQTASSPGPLSASSSPALTQPSLETLPAQILSSPTSTPAPLCGGPPVMVVLGVGVDTEDNTYKYGLGDAIRIARLDFVTPKVTVLTLPRDLWVEIPDISEHYGIDHGKLNQSYLYGTPGMGYFDNPSAGPGLMARTLDLNFGLRVDHYGAVNMLTFSRIIDAVGGIDIYLPTDVDGTPTNELTEDMGYFYAGQQHFTGDEALRFSRIRKRYNDLTRADHQSMVLCALKKKLLAPSVLPRIPQIISAFQGSVITDLSLEQMGQMACLLPYLGKDNLIFTSLPDEIMKPGRALDPRMGKYTFVMDVDFNVIRDYVSQFLDGSWPAGAGEDNTCQ